MLLAPTPPRFSLSPRALRRACHALPIPSDTQDVLKTPKGPFAKSREITRYRFRFATCLSVTLRIQNLPNRAILEHDTFLHRDQHVTASTCNLGCLGMGEGARAHHRANGEALFSVCKQLFEDDKVFQAVRMRSAPCACA